MAGNQKTALMLASLHVAQGRDVIERQERLIAHLRENGSDTRASWSLLACFERVQATFEADLTRLSSQAE